MPDQPTGLPSVSFVTLWECLRCETYSHDKRCEECGRQNEVVEVLFVDEITGKQAVL
jgi:hypothetical protein